MEQRNEPSTDIEITLKKPKNDELLVKGGGSGREPINTECAVRALNTIAEVSPQWSGAIRFAADRLEQQEQRIAELEQYLSRRVCYTKIDELERELATYKQTFCPECHMPMGSDEKKCSECDVSWALEGEGEE